MLHGNPTWSYLYRHLIEDLRKDYRCVALDHLGYGLSDKPPRADFSMEAHIRRLGLFVEELGLSDITLICQDWGGIIGLGYAAKNKKRFSRLIPMNTAAFLPETREDWRKCAKGLGASLLVVLQDPDSGQEDGHGLERVSQGGTTPGRPQQGAAAAQAGPCSDTCTPSRERSTAWPF